MRSILFIRNLFFFLVSLLLPILSAAGVLQYQLGGGYFSSASQGQLATGQAGIRYHLYKDEDSEIIHLLDELDFSLLTFFDVTMLKDMEDKNFASYRLGLQFRYGITERWGLSPKLAYASFGRYGNSLVSALEIDYKNKYYIEVNSNKPEDVEILGMIIGWKSIGF